MLPEDAATTLEGWIKSKTTPVVNEIPPDEGTTAPPTISPTPTPSASPTTAAKPGADKQKLDAIIKQPSGLKP